MPVAPEVEERFRRRLVEGEPEECWPWPGTRDSKGYGKFTWRGREYRAHRVALLVASGDPPDDAPFALHSCDNPPCCNARHLRWGTNADNQRQKAERGRAARGERNGGGGRLTEQDVREILALPGSSAEVAPLYNVSAAMVRRIRSRKAWAWVTAESST